MKYNAPGKKIVIEIDGKDVVLINQHEFSKRNPEIFVRKSHDGFAFDKFDIKKYDDKGKVSSHGQYVEWNRLKTVLDSQDDGWKFPVNEKKRGRRDAERAVRGLTPLRIQLAQGFAAVGEGMYTSREQTARAFSVINGNMLAARDHFIQEFKNIQIVLNEIAESNRDLCVKMDEMLSIWRDNSRH